MACPRNPLVSVLIVFLLMFGLLVLLTWPLYSVTNAGHVWENQNVFVNWWSIVIAPFAVGFLGMIMMLRIPASRRYKVTASFSAIFGTLLLVMLVVYPLTHSFDTTRHKENIQRELRPLLEQAGVADIEASLEDATAFSPFDGDVTFMGTIRGYLVTQFVWGCLGGALIWWGRNHPSHHSDQGL